MNVTTITMPKEQAQAKLEAYREQNRKRNDEEYQAAEAGYAALAEGTPLISLTEAIRGGGFDEKMRPKLAIARADRKQVHYRQDWNGTRWFDTSSNGTQGTENGLAVAIEAPGNSDSRHGYALVPMVPADVRQKVTGQLKDYFILWEVEQWADKRLSTKPDRDPYLLKHIGGDLYAVVAEWDLTPLERLVMAGRRDA